jgi:hypothetical protein
MSRAPRVALKVYGGGPGHRRPSREPDEPPPPPFYGMPSLPEWRRVLTTWPLSARRLWWTTADKLTPPFADHRDRAQAEHAAFVWVAAALGEDIGGPEPSDDDPGPSIGLRLFHRCD